MPEAPQAPVQDRRVVRRRGAAGRLKIGDEWMAIQIIARSQTNPQKAVAELVENSIDAGATRIQILRGRRRGRVYLRISDDGRGVPLTPDGVPDFDYVATHICDSLKRRLDERERSAVQGEFGIGLLGFWSIGRELEMVSQAARGAASVMTMRAGSRAYDRRRYLGARLHSGVDVTVHEVHREAQIRLTAEKLQRYLGEELRERIRRSGATIVIEDRLPPRKTLEVRPAAFRGEPIAGLSSIPVANHPPARAELFVRSPEAKAPDGATQDAEPPAVGLYRLGTRVCRNLADLPEFEREPWTSGLLEGMLDYADFHLAPATREGFLPDAAYHAFVEAVRRIEPLLLERLREEEEARSERASRSLVKELQSAFARLLRDLPAGVYDWFGEVGSRPFAGDGTGRPGGGSAPPAGPSSSPEGEDSRAAGGAGESPAGEPGADPVEGGAMEAGVAQPEDLLPQPALLPGPLERASLRPAPVRVAVGRSRSVRAVGLDATGLVIERDLTYAWSLSPEAGVLSVETGGRAVIEAAGAPARGTLRITIRQETGEGSIARSAETEVLVEAEAPRRAFPPPKFVHAPRESWRSRWSAAEGKVEVNTGHPDYQAVRKSASKRRRYFGRLYGKELVLHNFGLETPAVALERLLEVLTRLDEHL